MLIANLGKSASLECLIELERPIVPQLSPSPRAISQLLELYNIGANGKYNKGATYDYLAYLFADFAKACCESALIEPARHAKLIVSPVCIFPELSDNAAVAFTIGPSYEFLATYES